jgi:hypothetical protein
MRFLRSALAALLILPLVLASCAPELAFAATAGVTADVTASVQGSYLGTNDLGSVAFSYNQRALAQLSAGTGTGKADKLFSDTRTIAASSSENLDLAGVLADPIGATITCVKVKFIYVKASAANTNSVLVGGAASNGFLGPFADATDILTIPPGGFILLVHPGAGWTVTASTGDILKVANSGGTTGVDYDVIIGCATA